MKRVLASLGIAALLAIGLFSGSSVLKPTPALAFNCTGSIVHERWGPYGTAGFVSTYTGGEDYLYAIIETVHWSNDAGCKRFHVSLWTQHGTPMSSWQIRMRVWVCGVLAWNGTVNSNYFDIGSFGYGGCGPQADLWYNGYSWASGVYDANGTTYVYTTAT